MVDYHLAGKVAVVTGAARGIGLGIAQRLAEEGCRVVMNDIDQATLTAAAEMLAEAHDILAVPGDITDENKVKDLFERAAAAWGGLDILVNNAARLVKRRWLSAVDLADFDEMMRVNIRGVYLCSRTAAVYMARRDRGAIINISSVGANRAFRGQVAYITSKGAVEAMTRALAMDLAPYGIRVNGIGPGMIAANGWKNVAPEEAERRRRIPPLGREGFPDDIAAAVLFLASSEAGYITGQTLYVDGGLTCQLYSPDFEIPFMIDPPPHPYPETYS